MQHRNIDKLTEDTLQSFDGMKRAEPKPFLFTRVMASVNNGFSTTNNWTRIAAFISKPRIAIAGMLTLLLLNVAIYFMSKRETGFVQNNMLVKDEFVTNTATIYDSDNLDQ